MGDFHVAYNNGTKHFSIDADRIAAEEELDGYYAIKSSEVALSDSQVIAGYKQLWHIEESFRITKTDLRTRPIYVRTESHIRAHFILCFISLIILRILEIRVDGKYKASAILNSLRRCECSRVHENVTSSGTWMKSWMRSATSWVSTSQQETGP